MLAMPHDEVQASRALGLRQRIVGGDPRAPLLDTALVHDRIDELAPRVAVHKRRAQALGELDEAKEAAALPSALVQKLCAQKRAQLEARLGLPVFASVAWRRQARDAAPLYPLLDDSFSN